jgi:single-strand DNA-binding protein
MNGMNLHIINGTVGSDVEFNVYGTRNKATFSVAVNDTYTPKTGEKAGQKVTSTEWIAIECWGGTADFAQKFVSKGKHVNIQGSVKTSKYDKDGTTRYRTFTEARSISFLSNPRDNEGASTTSTQDAQTQVDNLTGTQGAANTGAAQPAASGQSVSSDDLPF